VLSIQIITYALIPIALFYEARKRKLKTGHAIPLQAMEDAENAQVSAAMHARIHEINAKEEEAAFNSAEFKGDNEERADHIEVTGKEGGK
jgi:hypothetical protein